MTMNHVFFFPCSDTDTLDLSRRIGGYRMLHVNQTRVLEEYLKDNEDNTLKIV